MFGRIASVMLILSLACYPTACFAKADADVLHAARAAKLQKYNGKVIRIRRLSVQGQNPNIRIFDVMYLSGGVHVEALLTAPLRKGTYPLIVSCHGGSIVPLAGVAHHPSPITLNTIKRDSSNAVVLYPQYRGYAESNGSVGSISQNTFDALNSLQVVKSLHLHVHRKIYLIGVSMGATVAMRLASIVKTDVGAVVVFSPFVGFQVAAPWLQKHPHINTPERNILQSYDSTNKRNGQNFTLNSPMISSLDSPILILQGTADRRVPWQLVTSFYDILKSNHKVAKLILYPGGHHGLLNRYAVPSNQAMYAWFKQYGV